MEPTVDPKVFRDFSYGLYIVTSRDGDRMNGQIINTAIQVTSDPPCVAVIINKKNLTHELIDKSKLFAVSVLDETTPMTFIGLFGFRSGRNIDKLFKTQYKEGLTKCPLVTEHAVSVLEAKVTAQLDLGSHTIFVGETINAETLRDGKPMTYQYYHQTLKGKSPPAAPTFQPLK
ncbi:MAG: flavin reductase family protein [Syntrophobacteraceae bacterium]